MSFFGTNIKKIRQVKGLSQKAFADLFDLNRGVISSYEEGRAEPKIETILKVGNYFNINLHQLLAEPLSVNHLVGVSDIDQLMFKPINALSKEDNLGNENIMIKESILQKILATIDFIYEFTPESKLLPPFNYGDILFLKKSDAKKYDKGELFIIQNGNLEHLRDNEQPDNVYKIVGSILNADKNILTDILERLSALEKKVKDI